MIGKGTVHNLLLGRICGDKLSSHHCTENTPPSPSFVEEHFHPPQTWNIHSPFKCPHRNVLTPFLAFLLNFRYDVLSMNSSFIKNIPQAVIYYNCYKLTATQNYCIIKQYKLAVRCYRLDLALATLEFDGRPRAFEM